MRKHNNKLMLFILVVFLVVTSLSSIVIGEGLYNASDMRYVSEYQTVTLRGYVVGEPISSNTVINNGFRSDYAIAIADSPYERNTNNMVFVKLDGYLRNSFGLASNPGYIGQYVEVKGRVENYFGHQGLKNVSGIEWMGDGNVPVIKEPDPVVVEPIIPPVAPPIDETGYYNFAMGKSGVELKSALNDIIDNHKELSYSKAWEALRDTDEDPNNPNNVILIYTGRSQSKFSNGGGIDDWNREHVWSKSHGDFGTRLGAGTDLHHLRPADVTVNSSRGNKNFDESGFAHVEAIGCFADSDSFEPRDEVKGDVARMIFYMATRYEGEHGEIDLEIVDYMNNTKSPYHGKLSTLLEWHKEDPVDDFERTRNEKIYANWQGNRNPFIDHPEWAGAIWN